MHRFLLVVKFIIRLIKSPFEKKEQTIFDRENEQTKILQYRKLYVNIILELLEEL